MRATICPNPKCHKKIDKPILLNNLSTIPREYYYACPHCFSKLDAYARMHRSLAGLYLTAFGLIVMALVGYLTWSKNGVLIGSSIAEAQARIIHMSIGELTIILFGGILFFVVAYGVLGARAANRR